MVRVASSGNGLAGAFDTEGWTADVAASIATAQTLYSKQFRRYQLGNSVNRARRLHPSGDRQGLHAHFYQPLLRHISIHFHAYYILLQWVIVVKPRLTKQHLTNQLLNVET